MKNFTIAPYAEVKEQLDRATPKTIKAVKEVVAKVDNGHGDYTNERHDILGNLSMDEIYYEIAKMFFYDEPLVYQ